MPLGGKLAYADELSPVSLTFGDENDLAYQDEDGDMTDDLEDPLLPMPNAMPQAMPTQPGMPSKGFGLDPRMIAAARALIGRK